MGYSAYDIEVFLNDSMQMRTEVMTCDRLVVYDCARWTSKHVQVLEERFPNVDCKVCATDKSASGMMVIIDIVRESTIEFMQCVVMLLGLTLTVLVIIIQDTKWPIPLGLDIPPWLKYVSSGMLYDPQILLSWMIPLNL